MSGANTPFNALVNAPERAGLDFAALKFAIGGGAAVQHRRAPAPALRWSKATA